MFGELLEVQFRKAFGLGLMPVRSMKQSAAETFSDGKPPKARVAEVSDKNTESNAER
jgi:hypothetical protein